MNIKIELWGTRKKDVSSTGAIPEDAWQWLWIFQSLLVSPVAAQSYSYHLKNLQPPVQVPPNLLLWSPDEQSHQLFSSPVGSSSKVPGPQRLSHLSNLVVGVQFHPPQLKYRPGVWWGVGMVEPMKMGEGVHNIASGAWKSPFFAGGPPPALLNTKMSKMNHNSLEWTNHSLTIETCTLLCYNSNTMLNVMLLDFQTWQLKWGGKRKSEWWTNR